MTEKKKRLLLVDDSSTILMMEKMLLGSVHYELITAKDGSEGVEKARSEKPDLILLDVVMPKLDGFGACRALRQDPATRAIPIIMVTTRGEEHSVEKGYAAGCNDYVTKPLDKTELVAKVRDLLSADPGVGA